VRFIVTKMILKRYTTSIIWCEVSNERGSRSGVQMGPSIANPEITVDVQMPSDKLFRNGYTASCAGTV
jgi:hypothetical protein